MMPTKRKRTFVPHWMFTVSRNGAEMTVEVRMDRRGDLVGGMLDVDGVHDATLVACQTEAGS